MGPEPPEIPPDVDDYFVFSEKNKSRETNEENVTSDMKYYWFLREVEGILFTFERM